jgi:hypothetical protein
MESFAMLRKKIRKWLHGGVTHAQIATHLRIHEKEVREIAAFVAHPEYVPSPETIREECARIRSGWTETEWTRAAMLKR